MSQGIFLVLRAVAGLIGMLSVMIFVVFCAFCTLIMGVLAAAFIAGAYVLDGIVHLYRQAMKLFGHKAK